MFFLRIKEKFKQCPPLLRGRISQVLSFMILGIYVISPLMNHNVQALESANVKSSFSANYTVSEANKADVAIKISLNNVGDNPTILTTYNLNVGYVNPSDVRASHGDRELGVEMFESSGYVIRVLLGEVLLRPGETHDVVVRYSLDSFFNTVGGGYEAVLPVFEIGSDTTAEYIKVVYAKSFGPLNYANTEFEKEETENGFELTFSDIKELDYVVFSAGESKSFGFDLEKQFTNEDEVYVQKSIIFIPELSTQRVAFSSISPYPDNAYKDDAGNIIFNYSIPPGEEVWVRFRGTIQNLSPGAVELETVFLSPDAKKLFLNTDIDWWKISDEAILADLQSLEEQEEDFDKIKWIYDYVIENLNLSSKFREYHGSNARKGAQVALKTYKNASAEDFADAFVAICRNSGIPARVVTGYVFPYSTSGDNMGMYHVWPQYWAEDYGWVSVDPAYEKFTGYPHQNVGLRRVVTSIVQDDIKGSLLGQNSEEIFLTNQKMKPDYEMNIDIEFAEELQAGYGEDGRILVTNSGSGFLYWNGVSISPDGLDVNVQDPLAGTIILPGDTKEIEFSVKSDKWYMSGYKDIEFMMSADGYGETFRTSENVMVTVQALWWAEPLSWLITVIFFAIVTAVLYGLYKLGYIGYKFIRRKLKDKNV